jgi:hypothetical protein
MVAGAIATSMILALPALAAVIAGDVELKGGGPEGGSSTWDVDNGEPFDTDGDGDGQCVVYDRQAFTPVMNGLLKESNDTNHFDAFDGGMGLVVGNKPFLDSDNAGAKVGQELAVGPETMSGLKVSERVRALQDRAILRVLATFKNPTNKPITKMVTYDSSMGSDDAGGTEIVGSSDSNHSFGVGDRWVATAQGEGASGVDPPVLQVLYGPKHPRVKSFFVPYDPRIDNGDAVGEYCVTVKYRITVPAGKTRSMLWFSELTFTHEQVLNAGTRFNTNRNSFFVGMSQKAKNKVLNWNLKP